jgi:hypothetical protein
MEILEVQWEFWEYDEILETPREQQESREYRVHRFPLVLTAHILTSSEFEIELSLHPEVSICFELL